MNRKINLTIGLILSSFMLIAQQDCVELELSDVSGHPCRKIDLTLEVQDATSYQWYKDEVVLDGQTQSTLEVHKFPPLGDGIYHVEIVTPTECYKSVPYEVERPEYFTDIGQQIICQEDLKPHTQLGYQRFKTSTAEGCDSTIYVEYILHESTRVDIYDTLQVGEIFISGNTGIRITESDTFHEILEGSYGCDSTVNYYLTFLESTSTLDQKLDSDQFHLYPNPIQKNRFINLRQPIATETKLTIINMLGITQMQTSLRKNAERIQLPELSIGDYFFVFEVGEKRYVEKVNVVAW